MMQILPSTPAHAPALAELRLALLEETGGVLDPPLRLNMLELNQAFFKAHVQSPLWQDWVAVLNGQVCSMGAMAFLLRAPYPGNPEGRDAYLLNMYTAPAYRGRGLARAIVHEALADARARGVRKVILHATEAGRRLYDKVGFLSSTAYMEFALAPA
jgi:GNAT superfamily N-acetyltransferase